jgi:hypothetical protein
MNDEGGGTRASKYRGYIDRHLKALRQWFPDAYFVLVPPSLRNPNQWVPRRGLALDYERMLQDLTGKHPRATVPPIASAWTALLARKEYYALTGNGVNHPNDFGHRAYASLVLASLDVPSGKVFTPSP